MTDTKHTPWAAESVYAEAYAILADDEGARDLDEANAAHDRIGISSEEWVP